jgi:AcrR family transcriptional regulator
MPAVHHHVPRRTPTQERARESCEAILQATAHLLTTSLPSDPPSTNRIAKRAGVSIGTLYQYFDCREDIVRALCVRHAEEMSSLILTHAGPAATASPLEAVPAFVDAMASAHAVAPTLHLALVREMLVDDGDLLARLQGPSNALVRAWLEHNRARIRPRDLDAAAFLLVQTVEAAIHGQLLVDPARLADRAWRAELVDLLLRYLVA